MELPERKRQILKAIVESYIQTAEPVGSKMIAGILTQPISSATIRNEMSELEELGFLEKPHVSAGRVPSYAAYRLYVDELMDRYRMAASEVERLQAEMRSRLRELDSIMVNASRIVSHFTDHTSVSIVDRAGGASVKRVQLVAVDEMTYAVVLVTESDARSKVLRLPAPLSGSEAPVLERALNLAISEGRLAELVAGLRSMSAPGSGALFMAEKVLEQVCEMENQAHSADVYVDGAARLLSNREYQDPEKARDLLDYLSDRRKMSELARGETPYIVNIRIGPENTEPRLRDVSFVFTAYDLGERTRGIVGVIGPTRMDYARTIARLSAIARQLSRLASGENAKYQLKESGDPDGRK